MGLRSILLVLSPIAVALAGLSSSYILPLDHDAILYAKSAVDNPVSRLQDRLAKGEVTLKHEDDYGYLRSVLKELGISVRSQVLVFSKTSFQSPRIAPRTPRALYFNDSTAVGFVQKGDVLELAAFDARQGIIFYTLEQSRVGYPHMERQDSCLQCHQTGATLGVPGLMVRSIKPDRNGMPVLSAGSSITDHRSALKERWGGWYVSGTNGTQGHMGNAVNRDFTGEDARIPILEGVANVTNLKPYFATDFYLTPHSDIVALMTLEHQTGMSNLIIRVGWEARMAVAENAVLNKALHEPEEQIRSSTQHRIDVAVEELLEYLLFSDEAPLTYPIEGTSGFREEFSRRGPSDASGRSLREFDLKTRMFRYPCSFMIYSAAFDAMPTIVKTQLYRRLFQVLSTQDDGPKFRHLSQEDRGAILQILRETKQGLPTYWFASHATGAEKLKCHNCTE